MKKYNSLYFSNRSEWRQWLKEHFEHEKEIWLIFPKKVTGKPSMLYNDAVEEALCFGWIDSTAKSLDSDHSMLRFTPRRPKSSYSQPNKERLKWLDKHHMLHPAVKKQVADLLVEKFELPSDIIDHLRNDEQTWAHFQNFSDGYKRIRIAYIEAARKRSAEFQKRLQHFIRKTSENKIIRGHGGIDKYY